MHEEEVEEVQGGMHALTCMPCRARAASSILTHSIWVGEALVPLDQGAVVHTDLSQREAEAEADDRHAVRLWPASLHFAVAMRVHASVGA